MTTHRITTKQHDHLVQLLKLTSMMADTLKQVGNAVKHSLEDQESIPVECRPTYQQEWDDQREWMAQRQIRRLFGNSNPSMRAERPPVRRKAKARRSGQHSILKHVIMREQRERRTGKREIIRRPKPTPQRPIPAPVSSVHGVMEPLPKDEVNGAVAAPPVVPPKTVYLTPEQCQADQRRQTGEIFDPHPVREHTFTVGILPELKQTAYRFCRWAADKYPKAHLTASGMNPDEDSTITVTYRVRDSELPMVRREVASMRRECTRRLKKWVG